jgi:hypothetical protein
MDYARLYLLYPTEILLLLVTALCFTRLRIRPTFLWTLGTVGMIVFVFFTFYTMIYNPPDHFNYDGQIFWEAGRTVLQGNNPYDDARVLNPPTALPLFALLALIPLPAFTWIWLAFNTIGYLLLAPFAQAAQRTPGHDDSWQLPGAIIAVLAPVISLSYAARYGQELGQLSVVTTLVLIGAVWAHGRERAFLAGTGLAFGTIKAGTMLPFLLLLNRKQDWKIWAWLSVAGLAMVLTCTPSTELITRCRECLHNIGGLRAEGKENDFSYANTNNIEIIGLDHAYYRLGLRDRTAVRVAEYATVLVLGLWTAWQVLAHRNRWCRAAQVSLVAFYAAVFLYHRHYDHIIMVLPLIYAMGRCRTTAGWARWCYFLAAFSTLVVMYLRVGVLRTLTQWVLTHEGSLSRAIEAVVLPYGTYTIIFGMFCLWAAEVLQARAAATAAGLPAAETTEVLAARVVLAESSPPVTDSASVANQS